MKVQVEKRMIYGREFWYPVNESAKVFASLVNRKTLLPEVIALIKQLGFEVEVVVPQPFKNKMK